MLPSANPVAVAMALAVHAGRVWDEPGRMSFAQRVVAALNGECEEVAGWRDALGSLGNLDQTPAVRKKMAQFVQQHQTILEFVARRLPEVARMYSVEPTESDPERIADWRLQTGQDKSLSPGEALLDPRFLEPGRFSSLPGHIKLPNEIYVAPGQTNPPKIIPIQDPPSRTLEALGQAMTDQWGFLYERSGKNTSDGTLNVNSLTRYAYNTFGVRRILQHLEQRDVRSARVLVVTAYETPLHELVECERVKEVVVVDLSRAGCAVVSDKYAHHPQAHKIRLRLLDYSGLEPQFQEAEINELEDAVKDNDMPSMDAILRHFSRIASGRHFSPLDFASDSFDAVHLPFLLGSLYVGPMTVVIGRCQAPVKESGRDGTNFIEKVTLYAEEAQQAAMAVMTHSLEETRRITNPTGIIIINLWGRPQPDTPHRIRLSDTLISSKELDQLMSGFHRLFSGNPQPTIPHTVGHIFASKA